MRQTLTRPELILSLLILLIFALFPLIKAGQNPKQFTITRIDENIKIDGKLDEPVYKTIMPASDFYQFHPKNGESPTFKTEVYAFFNGKSIFFAFRCYDNEPQKISADITPFGEFFNNDEVTVYLDTYNDRQTYEYFAVNPKGIKDGKKTVWQANVHINSRDWTVEMEIPFKSLRFPVRRVQEWTVNFKRYVFRLNETSFWNHVPRDKTNVLGDTFVPVQGLKEIRGGKNIEIFPYAGYRHSNTKDTDENKLAYGLDLKYGITSNLTLDLTSSPDYSEVESDPFFYQVQPYEYRLNEKRPFYFEGDSYFSTIFSLFYSRRINNPTLAAKVTGKEKGFSLGLLASQNKSDDISSFHAVCRLLRDIGKFSNIGIIYTSLEGEDAWNRNAGLDFKFKFKDIYSITGMAAYSFNKDQSSGQNGMYRLQFSRSPDRGFACSLVYNRIEPRVLVPAGFVSDKDTQYLWLVSKYKFRWEKKWIETMYVGLNLRQEGPTAGDLAKGNYNSFIWSLTTRAQMTVQLIHEWGKIRPKILDPAGQLNWENKMYTTSVNSIYLDYSGSRLVNFGLSLYWIDDFVYTHDYMATQNGRFSEKYAWINFKISPQLQFTADLTHTQYRSDDGNIHFNGLLFSNRINWQLSRNFFSFAKLQYDSYQKRFQYDFLIGFEPDNISHIYLSLKNFSQDRFRFFSPDARSLTVKISYLFRI